MPISSLADLFMSCAQNTVAAKVQQGDATLASVTEALRNRFGQELTANRTTLARLYARVREAVGAAQLMTAGYETPCIGCVDPTLAPGQWRYQTLVSIDDRDERGNVTRTIEVPLTVNSDRALSHEELLAQVEAMCSDWRPDRSTAPGGGSADLLRRDVEFMRISQDVYGGNTPCNVSV